QPEAENQPPRPTGAPSWREATTSWDGHFFPWLSMISRDVVRKIAGGMKHLIVILMAVIPFAMAWSGPLLVEMGHDHVARWVAQFGLLRGAAWGAMLLGG